MSKDTREQIEDAINEMIALGVKINASRVAAKVGVSHSLIYNRYPDLRIKIDKLKADQQVESQKQESENKVSELQNEVQKLKNKVKILESKQSAYKEQNEKLWNHIQEVYFMYDQILAERNEFAQRLMHTQ